MGEWLLFDRAKGTTLKKYEGKVDEEERKRWLNMRVHVDHVTHNYELIK